MVNSCSTSVCGTGEWSGPAPGDPSTDVVLTATATYGGIQVAWSYPSNNPHAVAHTLLYRSTSGNVATAVELAVVSGSTYFDRIATEGNYFYWIKVVSVHGTVGEFVGPASATARNRGEDTVADLMGRISADTLNENLKKDVQKITQTSEELRQEILNRIAANNALQGIVGGLQTDLEDAITYMGTESIERREGDSAIVGEVMLIAAANAENAAAITEERTARVDALSAVVTDVTTLQAATENYEIALQEEATLRAEETGALFAEKYVKIDLAGNAIGYGLSARVDPSGSTSNFRVSSDKFSISSPNYVGTTAPPANMRHQGKVWIDTAAGAGNEVVRWWDAGANSWSLVPIESAQPFVYYASPTTLTDGTIIQPGLYVNSALITKLRADQIDTRGLTIKDAEGNIIFGSGTGLDWDLIDGANRPQDGATRNVFRGNWATGSAYAVGDTVMDGGNGWSAKVAHGAVSGNRPPASGAGNTWWAAYTVKGDAGLSGIDGLTVVAPNTSHTLPATSTGAVTSYVGSGTTIQVYEGTVALDAVAVLTTTNSQFTVGTPTVSGTSSITAGGRTYSSKTATVAQHSVMSSTGDGCVITYPITLRRANGTVVNMSVRQTITKSKAGADGAKGDPGTQGIPGTPGANGVTLYTWVKYANDAAGTGISDSPSGKSYIGIAYNKTSATELDDPTLYTWSLIKGDQGIQGPVGPQGSPTYTWIKYANDASGSGMSDDSTGKTYIGIAVNKSTATEGTVASDYTWALIQGPKGDPGTQGIPGTPGANGVTLYTWVKYANGPLDSLTDNPTGKNYIGIAYNKTTATESTVYGDYTWSLIKGDQGIPGPAGANGQPTYTWIKYADNASGAGMSDSPTNKTHIGVAVNKLTADESGSVAADYTWSLIQGPKGDTGSQGIQGIPGVKGNDGVSLYTWIKYASTPTSGISDFPEGKAYIGVAYNKTTATESETYADYSWSLIKGDQGIQGNAGTPGQTTYTWIKYADSSSGTGMSDSPVNKTHIGIAVNKTTNVESTVAGDYTWALIQGPKGDTGIQGIQGPIGPQGQATYTWIKYADSPTTGMSDFPSGKKYLGVAYNKATATETDAYSDYSWSLIQGEQGIQGPSGPQGQATYTWVKYADDASGSGLSDSPTNKTYIGIAPNKTTAVESTAPGDYTWALFQGPQGADGEIGPAGPTVVVLVSRTPSFTSTDGVLDTGQSSITFTAVVDGVDSPSYLWTVTGTQSQPTLGNVTSITLTAAQFGVATSAIVQCTVNGLSDQVAVHRLNKSTAEAGATVGATLGHVTVNATVFTTDFANTSGWTNLNGGGEWVAVSNTGSIGGNALQIGNMSGDDQAWLGRTALTIPFNPAKTYRIRARVHAFGGTTGQFFLGLEAFKADGTTVIAKTGQELTGAGARISAPMHWVGASERVLPQDEWVEIEGYVRGHGGAGSGELSPNPATPVTMRTGTAYISPAIVANWSGKSGQVLVDYCIVEDVTYSPPNTQGKITPGNASTWIADAAIGNAQMANAAITNAKIAIAAVDTLSIKGNAVTVPEVFWGGSINSAPWGVEQQVVSGMLDFSTSVNAENPAGLIGFFSFFMEPETVDAFGIARVTVNGTEITTQSFGVAVNGGGASYRLPVVLAFSAKYITTQYVNVVCYAKSTTTLAGTTGLKMHILAPRLFLFGARR